MGSRTPFGSGGPARDSWSGGRTPMAGGDSSRTPAWGGASAARSKSKIPKQSLRMLTILQHLLGVASAALVLLLGRMTVPAPQTLTQMATAPPMVESATAHLPGTPDPRPLTTPALASMPSPPDPAHLPGVAPQIQTPETALQHGAVCLTAATNATLMMPLRPVVATLRLLQALMRPRPPVLLHPVAGPRMLLRLAELSAHQLPVAPLLPPMMRPPRPWVARLLRLVLTVAMTVGHATMIAQVHDLASFFFLLSLKSWSSPNFSSDITWNRTGLTYVLYPNQFLLFVQSHTAVIGMPCIIYASPSKVVL